MTATPQITAADLRQLLDSPAEQPVLYVKNGPDNEGGQPELDVWASALVDHSAAVLTRSELLDALGGLEPDDATTDDLRALLEDAPYQEQIDDICAAL